LGIASVLKFYWPVLISIVNRRFLLLGLRNLRENIPPENAEAQDCILGYSQPSLRD
jgi:hypothetical protein